MSLHPSMTPPNRWTFKRRPLPKNIPTDPHQTRNLCKTLPIPGQQMCRRMDRNSKPLVPSSASSGVWVSLVMGTKSISSRLSMRILRLQTRRHRSNVPQAPVADLSKSLPHKSLTRRNSRRKPSGWLRRQRNRNGLWRRRCRGNKRGPSCRRGTRSCRSLPRPRTWSGSTPSIPILLDVPKRKGKREILLGQRGERMVPTRTGVRLPSTLPVGGMERHRSLVGGETRGAQRPGGEIGTTTIQCHHQIWEGCRLSRSPLWIAILGLFDYAHGVRLDCTSPPRRHYGRHMTNLPNPGGRRIRCRTNSSCSMTFTFGLLWTLVLRCRTTGHHPPCRIFQ